MAQRERHPLPARPPRRGAVLLAEPHGEAQLVDGARGHRASTRRIPATDGLVGAGLAVQPDFGAIRGPRRRSRARQPATGRSVRTGLGSGMLVVPSHAPPSRYRQNVPSTPTGERTVGRQVAALRAVARVRHGEDKWECGRSACSVEQIGLRILEGSRFKPGFFQVPAAAAR